MEIKEYKIDRQKFFEGLIGYASFTALGGWLALSYDWSNRPIKYWLLCFGLAFFSALSVYAVAKCFWSSGSALGLSSSGIQIPVVGGKVFVPWAMIEKVGEFKLGSDCSIVLEMSDTSLSELHTNIWQRIDLWLTRNPDMKGVPVPSNLTAISHDELKNEIQKYWQASHA